MLKLYGYFRSSASYRVRIALNMKGLDYEQVSIHLAKGRQYTPEFSQLSPQNLVPVLEHDGQRLYQSLAIIEYLEEKFPQPALLPKDAPGRSRVRSLALISACEIHPLNNTRVLAYLSDTLKLTDEQKPKVKTVLEQRNAKMQELRTESSASMEERRAKRLAIEDEANKKMKEILTADQYKQYEQMEQRGRGGKGGPGKADAGKGEKSKGGGQ